MNGVFLITQIPPGVYTLQFSYLGYSNQVVQNVRVSSGRTANVNVELKPSALEGEEIVVIAERPPVDVGVASSSKLITAEEIQNIKPGTPVIMWTGFDQAFPEKRIHQAGIQKVMVKPIAISAYIDPFSKPYTMTCNMTVWLIISMML